MQAQICIYHGLQTKLCYFVHLPLCLLCLLLLFFIWSTPFLATQLPLSSKCCECFISYVYAVENVLQFGLFPYSLYTYSLFQSCFSSFHTFFHLLYLHFFYFCLVFFASFIWSTTAHLCTNYVICSPQAWKCGTTPPSLFTGTPVEIFPLV